MYIDSGDSRGCVWDATTHLAPLVQRLYGERVGSYVNDGAQLEPVGGVGRPHWPPILHGSPVVSTTGTEKDRREALWIQEWPDANQRLQFCIQNEELKLVRCWSYCTIGTITLLTIHQTRSLLESQHFLGQPIWHHFHLNSTGHESLKTRLCLSVDDFNSTSGLSEMNCIIQTRPTAAGPAFPFYYPVVLAADPIREVLFFLLWNKTGFVSRDSNWNNTIHPKRSVGNVQCGARGCKSLPLRQRLLSVAV